MNKAVKEFIEHARSETKEANVRFVLSNTRYLVLKEEGYARVNGYFDEERSILKCAVKQPLSKWLPILVHEYSHFQQSLKRTPSWVGCIVRGRDRSDEFFRWISGEKKSVKLMEECMLKIVACELECEKWTVKNIRKFHIPIDTAEYVKKSNAYLLFYDYAFQNRTWYKVGREPYNVRQVLKAMPSRFLHSYRITPKYSDLYDKYCS